MGVVDGVTGESTSKIRANMQNPKEKRVCARCAMRGGMSRRETRVENEGLWNRGVDAKGALKISQENT